MPFPTRSLDMATFRWKLLVARVKGLLPCPAATSEFAVNILEPSGYVAIAANAQAQA